MSANRLGRGLEALFQEHDIESVESFQQPREGEVVENLALETLRPNPYQPRKFFAEEKIDELTTSIQEHGIFQPIVVKKDIKGYIIIAGERRFKAAQRAGLATIPAIIREFNDHLMMEYALIENLQREDLTPIEEAEAYRSLMQKLDLTQEKLAEKIGKSRAYIANTLRLLQLPRSVQDLIESNKITVGHAKVLVGLKDKEMVLKLAEVIIQKNLSVRQLEVLIKEITLEKIETPKKETKPVNPHLESVESSLKSYFGTKVMIKEKQSDGKGQIIIDYMTTDDLNRLLEMMGVQTL